MSETNRHDTAPVLRAIELLVKAREDLSAELGQRARAIEDGRRRGRTWDETKDEILGRRS